MQETYQAVIVEDDPMIASIDQNFLEQDPRFHLAASFRSGQDALLAAAPPGGSADPGRLYAPDDRAGASPELRSFGVTSGVVMVTAANDSKTVDALLKLGVADYLVKPFTARRFQQALDKFCRQRSAIDTHSSVSREELDALLSGSSSPEDVPKGLQSRTLERIRTHLAQAPEEGCTCESLAAQAGLSSVTVRRYLTYLTQQGEVVSQVNYDTGGRPLPPLSSAQGPPVRTVPPPPVRPLSRRSGRLFSLLSAMWKFSPARPEILLGFDLHFFSGSCIMYPLSEQVSIQSRHFSPNQLKQIERRMNMKKFLASALSAALLLSALVSCSGSGSGSASRLRSHRLRRL